MSFLSKIKQLFINRIYGSSNLTLNRIGSRILFANQQRKLSKQASFFPNSGQIKITEISSLPELSWLAHITNNTVSIFHGKGVEKNDFGLIEGIWDGPFSTDFTKSDFVFGSGISTKDNQITFIPPKHCSESLFVLYNKGKNETYVSNSMCFCLESSSFDLESISDLLNGLDEAREHGMSRGIDLYNPIIFQNSNWLLQRFVYYNFSVGKNGSIKLYWTKPSKYFDTYEEYFTFINSKLNKLLENATSNDREQAFNPITTISRGYDSPAAAVLAKENGCNDALTLDVSVYGIDDCGLAIGKQLDMNMEVIGHILHDDIDNLNTETPENIKEIAFGFIATQGIGDDITFYPMKNYLRGRTLLSGVYGDFIWEKNSPCLPGLPKRGIFGKSITEFRLDTPYFHIPTACLGSRFAAPIRKIVNSKEMKPYSVGGDYDRPIPRRICEEAGINREEFGIEKCATAPNLLDHHSLFFDAVIETRKRYRF